MPNSELSFVFFGNDTQSMEISSFFGNTDQNKMTKMLDTAAKALGAVSSFYRYDSIRMVICSSDYIRDIQAQAENMQDKLDGTTYSSFIEDNGKMTIAFSVSKDNEKVELMPEPLRNKLEDKVTIAFVEFDKDP